MVMFENRTTLRTGTPRALAFLWATALLFSHDENADPVKRGVAAGYHLAETGDCIPSPEKGIFDPALAFQREHRSAGYALQFFRARDETCERAHSLVDFR